MDSGNVYGVNASMVTRWDFCVFGGTIGAAEKETSSGMASSAVGDLLISGSGRFIEFCMWVGGSKWMRLQGDWAKRSDIFTYVK